MPGTHRTSSSRLPRRRRTFAPCLLALLFAVAAHPSRAAAQSTPDTPPASGCTLHKDVYTCNWQTFQQSLAAAHTIAIETKPLDRPTATQLRRLAAALGKTIATADQPADLTFLLIPIDPPGITMGPADQEVATLRIYAPAPGTPRGTLLWAETLRAQPDRPWPAMVHSVIEQFQSRFTTP